MLGGCGDRSGVAARTSDGAAAAVTIRLGIARREPLVESLLVEKPVDVAAVYFTGIDTVSHLYWHFTFPEEFPEYQVPEREVRQFGDVIPRYYALIDGYIDGLLAAAGPETTVLVVSDHGFGATGYLPWWGGHDSITPGAPVAPPGVLLLAGPGIAHLETRLEAQVLDIAPTLLHLMGLPAAEDMPGRALVETLAPGLPAPLARVESWETMARLASTASRRSTPPVTPSDASACGRWGISTRANRAAGTCFLDMSTIEVHHGHDE